MHYFHIFKNRDYGIFVVYDKDRVIHQSVVTPRYFRFSFMSKHDLQIGATWTDPAYRRRGIASSAISIIISLNHKPRRTFWYVVEEDNFASVKVIEKAGFVKYGCGIRTERAGLRALGSFRIESVY